MLKTWHIYVNWISSQTKNKRIEMQSSEKKQWLDNLIYLTSGNKNNPMKQTIQNWRAIY